MTYHIAEELNMIAHPSIENEKKWVQHLRDILRGEAREEFFDSVDIATKEAKEKEL